MTLPLLKVAVVGHTNVGKTSLLRTLLRDTTFGEISDRPGTTRAVRGATIEVNAHPLLQLFDTPGLEDSIGLLEELEAHRADHRADGLDLVDSFLEGTLAGARFAQEAKALRQVLDCDAALYVVDAREQVLAKYRDELRILGYCAKPIVPVLNFVASEDAMIEDWRDQLARVSMHAVAEFDTVVLESQGETRLYEKMQSLLDPFRPTLEALIVYRREERDLLVRASARSMAEMLVDVAAFSMSIDAGDSNATTAAIDSLRNLVRGREQRCIQELLELHRFGSDEYQPLDLPIEAGRWSVDLFSPEALQTYGIGGGGGAAAGAMVGLTLDVVFGGLSLGTATAIGAAIGGAIGAGRLPGRKLLEKVTRRVDLRVEDSTCQLLVAREIDLARALFNRGHASVDPIRVPDRAAGSAPSERKALARSLRRAAGKRRWSRIAEGQSPAPFVPDPGRERLADRIARELEPLIRRES